MEQRSKDDLANALSKLADGDVAPGEEPAAGSVKPLRAVSPLADFSTIPVAEHEAENFVNSEDSIETPEDNWGLAASSTERVDSTARAQSSDAGKSDRQAVYKTLAFRRTIIPILLTCGVITVIAGSLKSVTGPDSLFSDLPVWLPTALLIAGVVLLVLAVINMLAVKHEIGNEISRG